MNLWDLARISAAVWKVARNIDLDRIVDLPDVADSHDMRAWCQAVSGACGDVAPLTPTELDDDLVAALDSILANDEAWAALHGLVASWFASDEHVVYGSPQSQPQVRAVATAAGIDPLTVIAIVQTIIQLVQWLRERRKAA